MYIKITCSILYWIMLVSVKQKVVTQDNTHSVNLITCIRYQDKSLETHIHTRDNIYLLAHIII